MQRCSVVPTSMTSTGPTGRRRRPRLCRSCAPTRGVGGPGASWSGPAHGLAHAEGVAVAASQAMTSRHRAAVHASLIGWASCRLSRSGCSARSGSPFAHRPARADMVAWDRSTESPRDSVGVSPFSNQFSWPSTSPESSTSQPMFICDRTCTLRSSVRARAQLRQQPLVPLGVAVAHNTEAKTAPHQPSPFQDQGQWGGVRLCVRGFGSRDYGFCRIRADFRQKS